MMREVLIAIHYLEIGGAESALIGLLNALDYERVNVDLFIYDHHGEMMSFIPEKVNILPQVNEYSMIERPISETIRRGFWRIAYGRLAAKIQHKFSKNKLKPQEKAKSDASIFHLVAKNVTPYLPTINPGKKYDVAISFLTPHNIVKAKVTAKKYIAWIHTDYSKVYINAKEELPIWEKYDKIVSISEGVTDAFLSVFPTLRNKIVEIPNVLPTDIIREQSLAFTPYDMNFDGIKILSIGRFSDAKNYDNLPYVAKLLKEKGVHFHWYIIGYGERSFIDEAIHLSGTSDCVTILGKRDNPYPYIKACDIYCQPSRYEGRSVTVEEAKLLCKPILLTNYFTAKYQIEDGVTGMICGMDNNSIAEALLVLSTDIKTRDQFRNNLAALSDRQSESVGKFYKMIRL